MAGKKGLAKSPEHKKKIAAAWTPEKRAAVAERFKGNTFASREWTEEQRKARSELIKRVSWNKGKKLSPEYRAKLSAAKRGKMSPRLAAYGITQERYTEELRAGNRWCFYRKHFSPADSFHSSKTCCSECKPEHSRKSELAKKFGVTPEWYDAKLVEQLGFCGICGNGVPSKNNKHLAVDHNHNTGEVRGLLCSRCNTALERLDSVPDWPSRALAYLQKYS